jgi:hypothetical protein
MPVVAAALIPAAPLLLSEITGPKAPHLAPVRVATVAALDDIASAEADVMLVAASPRRGRLAGFGAALPGFDGAAGWVHELGRLLACRVWSHPIRDVALPEDHRAAHVQGEALDAGEELATVLVLADGSITRGPRAPGGDDHRGADVDDRLTADLASGSAPSVSPMAAAGVGMTGLPGLAFASGLGGAWDVRYADAPAGVGYLVAVRGEAGPRPE